MICIPHRCWNGLRVYDPLALFCVLVSIIVVVIILLIAVIANWKEGSYNIIIYLVFWWGHSWEFHLVFWWGGPRSSAGCSVGGTTVNSLQDAAGSRDILGG